jgi:uncharacterized membrane protein YdjX (TVP38/TMEM64 family)
MRKPSASALVKLFLLLALIAAAVYFTRFTDTGRQITVQSVRDYVRSYPALLVPLVYIAIYVLGTVLFLPGTLLSFVGAQLFGLWEGTLYTWIGATIGATLAFLVARRLGRDFVNQLLSGRLHVLEQHLQRHAFMGLLVMRLVPVFPFSGLNLGCGLTNMRLRDFVLATALGILPGTFVFQYLFAYLGRALDEGMSWSDLADPHVLAPIGLFLAFILIGRWLARRLQPKPPS